MKSPKMASTRTLMLSGVCIGLIAVLISSNLVVPVIKLVVLITLVATGFILGLSLVLCSGKQYTPPTPNYEQSATNCLLLKILEARSSTKRSPKKVVFFKNLDLIIQEIMDFVTRDYIMNWYMTLGKDPERLTQILHAELWYVLEQFSNKLRTIENVRFLSMDVTTTIYKHFQNIRIANTKPVEGEPKAKFVLPPWLVSETREVEYLRKVATVFCLHLLPPEYATCPPICHLLAEILTNAVFKGAIDLICDPDYFNQKLLGWFVYREELSLEHKRTYTYAATYEDFMRMIHSCKNIEHLKEMRYNIISEIMQATTIQNLKRARGQDTDKESAPKGTTKGDLLNARNLTRYINQLTVTKTHCEKRISLLGGPDYNSYTPDIRREEQALLPGRKVLSFQVIMENETAQKHFMKYLHRDDNDSLLRFWVSVKMIRNSHRRHWHQLASDSYHMFIAHPTSLVRLKLDRATIRRMETFMIGNSGPEAFYEAQDLITQMLEEQFYPSYIVSDVYHHYITHEAGEKSTEQKGDTVEAPRTPEKEDAHKIAEHSTYAYQKLTALDEKLGNKTQALNALKLSQKGDKKILQLQEVIENEIKSLQTERHQVEFHIDRTDVWIENLGQWSAHIYNLVVVQEEQGLVPCFVIMVHLANRPATEPQQHTEGWVISRKLQDFEALHDQLVQIFPEYKKRKLPSSKKLRYRTIDTEFLDKAKAQLEDYLRLLLEDDRPAQSEAAFVFFSPSPEHLKFAPVPTKKAKFSLGSLLKGISNQHQDSDSDDDFIFVDGEGLKEERVKDSVAKPFYLLLNEVFELRGMFKWLRRTLMVFVKVSYGRSINRQVRDTVEWIISEPMLLYYLTQFRDAYWPNGEVATASAPRTDDEKLRTRMLAKEKFLGAIMGRDALKNLFGEQNTRQGTIKMFEALQDIRLNKHLFYELLELLLYELFPEIKQPQEETRPRPTPPHHATRKTPYLLTF